MSHKLLGLAVLAVFAAAPLAAQGPTPEGTTITNSVTVSYSDAEGNTYSANAAVSVKVGFKPGIDVQSAGTITPSTPSTDNVLNFTIVNNGNGADRFNVTGVTVGAGSGTLTITGYKIGSTSYGDLAALNAALNGAPSPTDSVAAAGSVVVSVVYDIGVPGGTTRTISMTAASVRSPATTDASTTNVSPPVAGGVSITATTTTTTRLPNNLTATYSTTFDVANGANAARDFTLTPTVSGSAILLGNVTVVGGTSINIAANSSATITVTYKVEDVAAGTTGTINLAVKADLDPLNVNGSASHVVTVIRPSLTLEKQVYRLDQSTSITAADRVLPGEDIYYKLTITNNGTAAATTLTLTDALPADLTYVSQSVASGTWTVTYDSGTKTLTATTASLGIGASNVIWIRATVN
jgi:uncharacterized repeat protein (TIGR01451 family)